MTEIVTAQWLMEQEFSAPTARDLLDSGECTPACLLARNEAKLCACRCNEYYHGALLDRIIDRAPQPKWWRSVGCPDEFLRSVPVTERQGALYKTSEPVIFVRRQGKLWQAVHDAVKAVDAAPRADAWLRFSGALLKSHRCRQVWASMDLLGWMAFDGVADLDEAKTCIWITLECLNGRADGANAAFELLSNVEIATS